MLKVVVLSYGMLTKQINELEYNIPRGIYFKIIDVDVDNVMNVAKSLEDNNEVDVFVSSGANARRIIDYIKKPLISIKVTGFDFLEALYKAMKTKGEIALLSYKNTIKEFKNINA